MRIPAVVGGSIRLHVPADRADVESPPLVCLDLAFRDLASASALSSQCGHWGTG